MVGAAALAVLALVYVVSLRVASSDVDSTSPADSQREEVTEEPSGADSGASAVIRRNADDPLSIGSVDAPAVLVVYSDYQCPYCAAWNDETLPVLMEYVDDDQLRIEWRDLNVYGQDSERASLAAYAAGLQGKFWEYHEALFKDGETRQPDELSEEGLVALAGDLGLNTEQFSYDMNSNETLDQIFVNALEGVELGAHSTPSFVLNDMTLVGAQPTEVFVGAVDEVLADGSM